MKNAFLLCAAMTVAAPAFAQTATPSAPATATSQADQAQTTAPVAEDPATATQGAPVAQQPADGSATATPQASGATQVAQVVDSEFASYDKNKDGVLSPAEFGDWMIALKTASDPSTNATAPATQTWIGRAFASADKDRSKTVSKSELTGFLSQGRS